MLDHFAIELALTCSAGFSNDLRTRRRSVCVIDDRIECIELAYLVLRTKASQVFSYVQISLEHAHCEAELGRCLRISDLIAGRWRHAADSVGRVFNRAEYLEHLVLIVLILRPAPVQLLARAAAVPLGERGAARRGAAQDRVVRFPTKVR